MVDAEQTVKRKENRTYQLALNIIRPSSLFKIIVTTRAFTSGG